MAPRALLSLLQVLESQVGDFSGEESTSIDGHAAAALREAEGNCGGDAAAGSTAPALHHLLCSFGWDGRGFSRPLDARCLASRLKAFLFDGLSQRGSGSYSVVYRARSRVTGGSVMLKRLRLERSDEGLPSTAVREVSLLRELAGSPHIVQLLDVMWDHSRLYLVMEHLDCDLREHLDRCPAARELPNVKSCMYQILKGMAHAHAHRVLHRDLKPQNILVDRATGCIKVADLGLARTFAPPIRPYTHEVVTLLYRAPEVLLGSPLYSTPLDVWSLGCILAELATGQPLFQGDSEIGQLLAIFQLLGTPGEPEWPGVSSMPDWSCHFPQWRPRDLAEAVPQLDPLGLDLLRQMLRYEPYQRIRCRQALAHPWFDDIRQAEEERSKALKQRVCEEQAHMRACIAAAASSSHLLSFSNEPSLTQQPSQASAQTGISLPAGGISASHC